MKANYSGVDWHATLQSAKQILTVHRLWLYFALPGAPGKSCHSPFRTDKKKSFSVTPSGFGFNDLGTAESGDAVRFFQLASGLDMKETMRRFIEVSGVPFVMRSSVRSSAPLLARPQPQTKAEAPPERAKPVFPDFRKGTPAELDALSKLRGIGIEGLQFAAERGLLRFATLKGCPAWVVTDGEGANAQARRCDGQPWAHIDNSKAWTLPGSRAAWPIGVREAQPFQSIALVEGGPDLLAAHYLTLWEQASSHTKRDVRCALVAMLGASLSIPEDALPLFAGKRVRIFGHADDAGRKAAARWATQLETVGADVDAFDFAGLVQVNGSRIKDLNDALFADAKIFAEMERIMP